MTAQSARYETTPMDDDVCTSDGEQVVRYQLLISEPVLCRLRASIKSCNVISSLLQAMRDDVDYLPMAKPNALIYLEIRFSWGRLYKSQPRLG
jgi:hypothetical protein